MEPAGPKKRATYQDVLDAPEHVVAEVLDGELVVSPRPASPAMTVASSTEKHDRSQKLRIYLRAGVQHAWLVHPRHRTLEAYSARDGVWQLIASLRDNERARIAPFDAIETDLAMLWVDLPIRAGEEPAQYELGR